MDLELTICLLAATIICLAPLAAYALGLAKDPFHPLLMFGGLAFAMVVQPPLFHRQFALELVNIESLAYYELIVACSILAMYLGWYAGHFKSVRTVAPAASVQYDDRTLLQWGIALILIGMPIFFITYETWSISGWLRDFTMIWVPGCVLVIQAIVVNKRNLVIGTPFLVLGLLPAMDRFFNYGQRGDTLRTAILVLPFYFIRGKRPSRLLFLGGSALLAITIVSLTYSRGLLASGDATGRLDALYKAGKSFLSEERTHFERGSEFVFGSLSTQVARETGTYGHGAALTIVPIIRAFPKEFFSWKYGYFYMHHAFDRDLILEHTGIWVEWGAAPTGFAEMFVELWWFFPIPWFILGYVFQRVYVRATDGGDWRAQGLLVGLIMGTLYLITQEIYFATLNYVFCMVPLALAYRQARIPAGFPIEPDLPQPALAATA